MLLSRIASLGVPVVVTGLILACRAEVAGGAADGAAIFSQVCSRCHGSAGKPDESQVVSLGVADLTTRRVQHELSIEAIAGQVRGGSANGKMPAFEGALSEAQIEAVAAHIKRLDEIEAVGSP